MTETKTASRPGGALAVIAALMISACIQGCGYTRAGGSLPDPDGGLSAKEAPMLSRLVREGKLPPLAERLPREPLVVRPYEAPGYYGGVWHMSLDNPDLGIYKMIAGYAPLMRWRADCTGLEPGTATRWEYSPDGTRLTIHLRHGIRWSDGVEFTSADFMYWYRLCEAKKVASIQTPFWSQVDGKDMSVQAPDAYTLVMRFAGPNWYVPLQLATGYWWCEAYNLPRHYMQQFDPDFNHKYKDYQVFQQKNLTESNPDRPTLWPWKLKSIEEGGYRYELERNPYYYMVDNYGRQLPYIDHITGSYVPDPQVQVLKILSGQVDAQFRGPLLQDYALYAEGQKRGGYRVILWKEATGANTAILLNWSPPDPVLQPIVRDRRFRQALSFAVDKEKCTEVAWKGLGVAQQATVSREGWHFRTPEGRRVFDEWARSYAAFDLDKANRLLDQMGLTRRDSEHYRLRPDGQRLSLLVDVPPQTGAGPETDDLLIARDGWEKIGIETILHTFPDAEIDIRRRTGKYVISTHGEAEMDLFTFPDWVFPTTAAYWHPLEGLWYNSRGKQGKPPTGPLKKLIDIYNRIMKEKDINRAHRLVLEAVKVHISDGPFCIGTTGDLPSLIVAKNNFRNVPLDPRIIGPWAVAGPATSYPETFFFAPPGWHLPAAEPVAIARRP